MRPVDGFDVVVAVACVLLRAAASLTLRPSGSATSRAPGRPVAPSAVCRPARDADVETLESGKLAAAIALSADEDETGAEAGTSDLGSEERSDLSDARVRSSDEAFAATAESDGDMRAAGFCTSASPLASGRRVREPSRCCCARNDEGGVSWRSSCARRERFSSRRIRIYQE